MKGTQIILDHINGREAAALMIDGTLDDFLIAGDAPLPGTIYRARALLATLTAVARSSRLFNEFGVQEYFTFFDLAKLFGFSRITISDGASFTHQIYLK